MPVPRPSARSVIGSVAVAGVLYGWWATGLRPFTTLSYVSIGVPTLALAVLAAAPAPAYGGVRPGGPEARRLSLRSTYPWVLLLALAGALEGLGLVLGGRSSTVPTLSTVVDHALAWHAVRFVLFGMWLAAGAAPLARLVHPENDRVA